MSEITLADLRKLRVAANALSATSVDDLRPYRNKDEITFRVKADSSLKDDASAASTCTGLMMLAAVNGFTGMYARKEAAIAEQGKQALEAVTKAIDRICEAKWDSSGLGATNAFTRVLVFRALGFLKKKGMCPDGVLAKTVTHQGLTLQQIADDLIGNLPSSVGVERYPSTPTLGYWFLDAIDSLDLTLDDATWKKFASWAREQFTQHISLIVAKHEAKMDPVAAAMAACIAARLRRMAIAESKRTPISASHELPSTEELRHGISLLFEHQGRSGIWPKYFPLFHYPEAGANYCFSFELLEAVLHEFGDSGYFLRDEATFRGLSSAVTWCERNRLVYPIGEIVYRGWNSGGHIESLSKGIPESWATGVVHMFLNELKEKLSSAIQDRLLGKYGATRPSSKDERKWNNFIDIPVTLRRTGPTTVKTVLQQELFEPAAQASKDSANPFSLERRRAALLFGPPGTSKTTCAKALAARLGWPYVEISPSHFLSEGLERIPIRANEVFDDLMDLSSAVILFDEMDAMIRRRDSDEKPGSSQGAHLDLTSELLTTSMLPKLAELYGRRQVIYFFATNHRRGLDDAITRPGRFDIWLRVGPPSWSEVLKNMATVLGEFGLDENAIKSVADKVTRWTTKKTTELNRFTFAEIKSLFESVCHQKGKKLPELEAALDEILEAGLETEIDLWHAQYLILRDGTTARVEYDKDEKESRLQ
jgi:hypothetical protein